jgi:hypothetical protein
MKFLLSAFVVVIFISVCCGCGGNAIQESAQVDVSQFTEKSSGSEIIDSGPTSSISNIDISEKPNCSESKASDSDVSTNPATDDMPSKIEAPIGHISNIPKIHDIKSIYAYDPDSFCYVGYRVFGSDSPLYSLIQEFTGVLDGVEQSDYSIEGYENELLIWTNDGVRCIYATSGDNLFYADGLIYKLPSEKMEVVKSLFKLFIQGDPLRILAYPKWLIWMHTEKIVSITYYSPSGMIHEIKPELFSTASTELYVHGVMPVSYATYSPKEQDMPEKSFRVEICFDNGVIYKVFSEKKALYIESSDMTYGCKYIFPEGLIDSSYLCSIYETIANAESAEDVTPNPSA